LSSPRSTPTGANRTVRRVDGAGHPHAAWREAAAGEPPLVGAGSFHSPFARDRRDDGVLTPETVGLGSPVGPPGRVTSAVRPAERARGRWPATSGCSGRGRAPRSPPSGTPRTDDRALTVVRNAVRAVADNR
jgi:hypothetical protein